jgi:hypothetical protein
VGFVGILGAVALVLALAVLASSLWGLRVGHRWLCSMPTPSAAQLSRWSVAISHANPGYLPSEPPPTLSELTDEQLCDEWRTSYLALQGRVSRRRLMRIVQERQRYLDEFERRNPGALTAWLGSGAWASSTPLPFLREKRVGGPGINWDQLMREQGW